MAFKTLRSDRELVMVHSSDLHIEHDYMGSPNDGDPVAGLNGGPEHGTPAWGRCGFACGRYVR